MAHGLRLTALLVCTIATAIHAQSGCVDRGGRPIPGVVDNSLKSAGGAVIRNGERLIVWNEVAAARSSKTGQLFLYLHECAHHTLGHLNRTPSPRLELEADCWAFQLLAEGGLVKGKRLREFEMDLAASPGDALHLGGPALLDSLQRCLDVRVDPSAWAVALDAFSTAAKARFDPIRGDMVGDANPGTYESRVDAPGSFDCEVLEASSVRCLLFASRKSRDARDRYQLLTKIVHRWLPPEWTSTDQRSPWADAGIEAERRPVRQFLAQDSTNGTLLALLLTPDSRVYLVMRRTSEWLTMAGRGGT